MSQPDRPAVEFIAPDDSDAEPNRISPIVHVLIALGGFAAAGLLAFTDFWDENIVGYTGRRRGGLVNLIESLGVVTWIGIALAIAALALTFAVINVRKDRAATKE